MRTRRRPAMRMLFCVFLLTAVGFSGCIPSLGTDAATPRSAEPSGGNVVDALVIEGAMRHLRNGDAPEWNEFDTGEPDSVLMATFQGKANDSPAALKLTQHDVRREWRILLNGEELGTLEQDERLMTIYRAVPARLIEDGINTLEIRQVGSEVDDVEVGRIIQAAIGSMARGSVVASFGLLPMITVNDSYGPGDVVPASDEIQIDVRVLAPQWLEASRVLLYVNGREMRVEERLHVRQAGEKGAVRWTMPLPDHDVFLAAVAVGPGETPPFWPVPKPYRRMSADWTPHLVGVTGAVWVDADGDGRPTPASTYAERLVDAAVGDLDRLVASLPAYDEAVAVQAAALLYNRGELPADFDAAAKLADAPQSVRSGFQTFLDELGANEP